MQISMNAIQTMEAVNRYAPIHKGHMYVAVVLDTHQLAMAGPAKVGSAVILLLH